MLSLALDPNVYLAAHLGHSPSEGILDDLFDNRKLIRLILDRDDGAILEAYEELVKHLTGNPRERLLWLLENQQVLARTLPVSVDCLRDGFLQETGCDTPVEPHLLALCAPSGRDIKIFAVGKDYTHTAWKHRGFHSSSTVQELKEHFDVNFSVWCGQPGRRALSDALCHQPIYPHTEEELEEFLERNRYTEGDMLEFKQPHNNQPGGPFYLTKSILRETTQAICALSNSYGGKVLLGIAERNYTGWIEGFTLEYKSSQDVRPKTWDEIFNILATTWLPKISPPFAPSELRYDKIELPSGRGILVFDVQEPEKDKRKERRYSGVTYVRRGRQTVRIA
jgi:hypothetical protein